MSHDPAKPSERNPAGTPVAREECRRARWCYRPLLLALERRVLLAGPPDLSSEAVPLPVGTPIDGSIGPLGAIYYRVSSDAGGKLTVTLDATDFAARLSLVDADGSPVVQSDGPASGAGDRLIDVNVPAGDDFLELQSLSGGGAFEITACLTPSISPFQTIPSLFSDYAPLAAASFFGVNSPPDLVAPDGIHVGNGDGTFQSTVLDGPLAAPGWTVTAIAVGDFDDNGLPDIAFTETNPNVSFGLLQILLNQGDGHFEPGVLLPIGSQPDAIEAFDSGGDVVDLAVADEASGNVAIFTNNGHGYFSPGQVLPGGVDPSGLVAGQFGDGHLDLIVADQGGPTGAGGGLTVFQADGPGQFQFARAIDLGGGPSAIVAGEFGGNGTLDLAVAEANSSDVSILLNNGNGAFAAPQSYTVGSNPLALVAGDFGNGHLDLATANSGSGDISVLLGNGDGSFQPYTPFGAGSYPASIVTADFNEDGRADLAVGNQGSGIAILLGNGDGTFQDQLTNPVGNYPKAVVTADLTHDSYNDIVTANYSTNDISVLMGNGDGTFQPARSFPAGAGPVGLVVGDFNGDGRPDVAVVDGGDSYGNGQGVSILLGNGDGTFQTPATFIPMPGSDPTSIVAGDFTGDGVLDLAVTTETSHSVTILMGDGDGRFHAIASPIFLGPDAVPVSIAAGNFTGGGTLDLAVADQFENEVWILQGDGHGGFRALSPIVLSDDPYNQPQAIVAGNFTGGGLLDLAVASISLDAVDNVSILLAQGNGSFLPLPPIPLGTSFYPTAITTAQLSLGGPLDLAVADSGTTDVSLLEGDGHGQFQPVMPLLDLGSGLTPFAITAGDFTGDGLTDLAVATADPNTVAIELNLGGGQFTQSGSVGLAPHNTPLVADLNGDGLPDVTIVDAAGDILFRQGQPQGPGSFAPPIVVNPGRPSRDIAAVVTNQGTFLASVDATDQAVSLFAYRNGSFGFLGSLATGVEPAQIVSADLQADGQDDLVIRNAGDGTLTIYLTDAQGAFLPPITLAVGPGISDVSVADVNQDGLPDLLLANQTAGEVEVILNQGAAGFSPPVLYRAGVGLASVVPGTGATSLSLLSEEGTVGVAAAALETGGPPALVALNSGSETLGILDGLGAGRFANPVSLPTSGPTLAVRIGEFTGDGNADLAILGPNGLSIWLGNGKGEFTPAGIYDVGPDPTGLTVADLNPNRKIADLLVGNAFGDVLVLLGQGNGVFSPPVVTGQYVGLAVGSAAAKVGATFVFVDQSRDRILVQKGAAAQPTVLADRTTGLLLPGAPVLADLNGDGIPDLIVPNTGGNNVLVYPGLAGGGFGPAMNDGNGFFTGTDPVSVTVADVNGDGRPDLIVADEGSNDVAILINEPQGTGFTFAPARRFAAGGGPVAALYGNFTSDGIGDLLVSDSASNELTLIPGVGDGFFNVSDSTVFPLNESPGPIFAGPFESGAGLDIVALDPGTSDVTLISGLATGAYAQQIISSGGSDPIAALPVRGSNGFEDLFVANNGDGTVSLLLGSADGLILGGVDSLPGGLSPTGLGIASIGINDLDVYAATENADTASLLLFSLNGLSFGSSGPGLTLAPLQDSSLPLIGTPGSADVNLTLSAEDSAGAQGVTAAVVALSSAMPASLGQGPFGRRVAHDEEEDDGELVSETDPAHPPAADNAVWKRVMIGLDEAFEEFRRATQPKGQTGAGPESENERESPDVESPENPCDSFSQLRHPTSGQVVDSAVASLYHEPQRLLDVRLAAIIPPIRVLSLRAGEARAEPVVALLALAISNAAIRAPVAPGLWRNRRTKHTFSIDIRRERTGLLDLIFPAR